MIINGNAIQIPLKDESVQLCCFSPPYWGLRRYDGLPELIWGGGAGCQHEWENGPLKKSTPHKGLPYAGAHSPEAMKVCLEKRSFEVKTGDTCRLCGAWRGDLGLEPDPCMYLDHMAIVMAEVWRVLRGDGVCFVNLGDSYGRDAKKGQHRPGDSGKQAYIYDSGGGHASAVMDLKTSKIRAKSLCLIPQKFAIRCQEAGWIIRSEIIWSKPNPMPESVKDRPTKAHETVWMMTKEGRYFWDMEAVREEGKPETESRYKYQFAGAKRKAIREMGIRIRGTLDSFKFQPGRNIRTVWTIATEPTPEAHFATWPTKLVERMIRAASKPGDIVLDPFCGTGKTVQEAERMSRTGIGLDLSLKYLSEIAAKRLAKPLQRELTCPSKP